MRILLSALSLMLVFTSSAWAQSVTISDIKTKDFQGVKHLPGIGYYTVYEGEKSGFGKRMWQVEMYDYNLNLIKKQEMEASKNDDLAGGTINGENFVLAVVGGSNIKPELNLFLFDQQGNKLENVTLEGKDEIDNAFMDDEALAPEVYAAGEGYMLLTYEAKGFGKMGYQLHKYNERLGKSWKKDFMPDRGVHLVMDMAANEDVAVLSRMKREKVLSPKATSDIVGLDTRGNEIFNINMVRNGIHYYPTKLLMRDGEIWATGVSFNDEKITGNADGIFFMKIDEEGEELFFTEMDYNEELKEKLNESGSKQLLGGSPFILFHDIVKAPNGKYHLIGETYTFGMSTGAVAMTALTGSAQIEMQVRDLVLITVDEQSGKVENVNLIEKEPYVYPLGQGSDNVTFANANKQQGLFGYRFTQKNEEGQPIIGYFAYGKSTSFSDSQPQVGLVNLSDPASPEVQKVELDEKAVRRSNWRSGDLNREFTGIHKSKNGKVMLYSYDKKADELNLDLVDLSF